MTTLGERLVAARQLRGLTQPELAELIGQDVPSISRFENGVRLPPLGTFKLLCVALRADANELLGLDE